MLIVIIALIALVIVLRRARIGTGALVTIMAIVLAGAAAGTIVSPVFYVTTFLLAGALLRAQTASKPALVRETPDAVDILPPALQASVTAALQELPAGEARGQLLRLIADAHPLYASPSTRFDEREERETRNNVDELIDACCASALELSAIDSVVSANPARLPRGAGTSSTPSGEVNARLASARQLMVKRLSEARTAVRTLYAADVEQGTSASERVVSLAAEIKADASARRGAITDVDGLLR